MGPPHTRSNLSRIRRPVVLGVATAVLLEVVLQLLALFAWLFLDDPGARGDADRVVLCIADSFTYGIGASRSETSYPAQLEALLGQLGSERWRVIRAAAPGRNSRAALEEIDDQLAVYRPDFVYVLVGLNDRWTRPDRLELGAAPAGAASVGAAPVGAASVAAYRLEWRTGRLLAWCRDKLTADPWTTAVPADGPAGPVAGGDGAHPTAPDDPWAALAMGQLDRAVELFDRQIEADGGRAPYSRMGIVQAQVAAGRPDLAQPHVDWLRRELERQPADAELAATVVASLAAVGDRQSALVLARELVVRFPESPSLWHHLAWQSHLSGDRRTAESAIEQALSCVPPDDPAWRAKILRERAAILYDSDRRTSLASIVERFLIDGDRAQAIALLTDRPDGYPPELLAEVCDALHLDRTQRERVAQLFDSAFDDRQDALSDVLAAHLRQIVARVQQAGAVPVLLSYPEVLPYVERSQQQVMRQAGVERIDLAPVYRQLLQGRSRSDLFVADGHLNDAGYGVLAAQVLADLRRRAGGR